MKDNKIFEMSVSNVYPLYENKVEKKGHTQDDLQLIITWLGEFLKSEREQIFISSKVGYTGGSAPENLSRQLSESRKRLKHVKPPLSVPILRS